jgi:hypothetical protein
MRLREKIYNNIQSSIESERVDIMNKHDAGLINDDICIEKLSDLSSRLRQLEKDLMISSDDELEVKFRKLL